MEIMQGQQNRMTIKELLDRVDLDSHGGAGSPIPGGLKKFGGNPGQGGNGTPQTYLGPKLYSEDDFFVMNLDEFLEENNLMTNVKGEDLSPEPEELPCGSPKGSSSSMSCGSPTSVLDPLPSYSPHRPGVIVAAKPPNKLPRGGNEFLYSESKRARIDREREERKRKLEAELNFAPEDLALATVPGADFDPTMRAFDSDELRPQPIIRKRPKLFVPDECKDTHYWDKRTKNNIAARRSREARRLKENQIALRAAFLEKENASLRKELEDTKFENSKILTEKDILKMKLSKYEAFVEH